MTLSQFLAFLILLCKFLRPPVESSSSPPFAPPAILLFQAKINIFAFANCMQFHQVSWLCLTMIRLDELSIIPFIIWSHFGFAQVSPHRSSETPWRCTAGPGRPAPARHQYSAGRLPGRDGGHGRDHGGNQNGACGQGTLHR